MTDNKKWSEEEFDIPIYNPDGSRRGSWNYVLPRDEELLTRYVTVSDSMTNEEFAYPPFSYTKHIFSDKEVDSRRLTNEQVSIINRLVKGSGESYQMVCGLLTALKATDKIGRLIMWEFLTRNIILHPHTKYFKNRIKPLMSEDGYQIYTEKHQPDLNNRITFIEILFLNESKELTRQFMKYVNRTVYIQKEIDGAGDMLDGLLSLFDVDNNKQRLLERGL